MTLLCSHLCWLENKSHLPISFKLCLCIFYWLHSAKKAKFLACKNSSLAIVSRAALKTRVHGSLWILIFFWLWVQTWDCRAMWFLDVYLIRNLLAVFDSSCTHLQPHQECRRIPICLHPLQSIFSVDVLDRGHSDLWEGIFHGSFDLCGFNIQWCADVHAIANSRTQVSNWTEYILSWRNFPGAFRYCTVWLQFTSSNCLLERWPCLNSCLIIYLGHDWMGGVIYSPAGLVNMKSPTALCLKLLFWKTALRKYHCFLPHSGPQALSPKENCSWIVS